MQVKDNLVELEVVYSKLNKALDENISRLNAGATAVDNYNKKISVVPSEFQKSLTDIKVKTDAVTISAKKLEQQSIKESNARNALNKQREVTIKQLEREQAKLQASQNLYNKTQQQLNNVTKAYNDLITRKLRYDNLSENEEKRLITLQKVTERYNTTLKAVDATIGKHQRNVGNYASAFNPLSNSINQLTREMPSFTYSVQTGFMALSNNIPIFTDAIGNAIEQNKVLRAEGKPTTSVLKQLAGAFFSWQTLLGVGITLLTVYGKEIGAFIQETFKGSTAINVLKESQKQLNDASTEGAKNAVEETIRLKSLLSIAKDTSLSYKERVIAVNELQSTYPAYFGNLKQEQILAGNTAIAERALTEAILSRAKANAAVSKITANQGEIIDIDEKILTLQKELTVAEVKKADAIKNTIKVNRSRGDSEAFQAVQTIGNVEEIRKKIKALQDEKKLKEDINNRISKYAIEKQKEAILLDYKEEKGIKSKTEAKKKDADVEEMVNSSSLNALQNTISALKNAYDNATIGSVRYELLGGQIKLLEEIYNGLTKSVNASNEAIDDGSGIALDLGGSEFITDEDGDRLMEEGDKLRELLKEFKQGFIDDFADQSGFGKFLDILGGGLDKFEGDAVATALAVSDAFQEAFNTINELSNQSFENEYLNLEKRKETALMFAGDSATAQSEIERQAEEKRKQIAEREFKAQKAQALFNIAVNTAQAVIGALATLPSPSAVPLSIAVGAIGLAQAGIVASREIPQYWTGTDNAKEGFALTQERGREIIMDRFGKIKDLGSDDGARLTKMKAGDKVLNNEKTMELLMFNSQFNSKLAPNLNTMPNLVVNNNTDFTPIIKAIQNKPETILNFDNGEFKKFVRNGNSIKETTQIRNGFKGLRV